MPAAAPEGMLLQRPKAASAAQQQRADSHIQPQRRSPKPTVIGQRTQDHPSSHQLDQVNA